VNAPPPVLFVPMQWVRFFTHQHAECATSIRVSGPYFFSGHEVNPIGRFFSGGGVISSRMASNTTLN
jgi:hypothetical protein